MVDPRTVQLIDALRSRGVNHDEVVAALKQHGLPERHVERVLGDYMQVRDGRGRPRGQVNPGEPGWEP